MIKRAYNWIKKKIFWFLTATGILLVAFASGEPVVLSSAFDHNGKTIKVEYCNKHPDYPLCGKAPSISGINPEYEFTAGNKTKTEVCDIPTFPGADVLWIKEQVEDVAHWRTVDDYEDGADVWSDFYSATITPKIITGTHEVNNSKDEWHEVSEVCIPAENIVLLKIKMIVAFNGFRGTQGDFEIKFKDSILR